MRKLVSMSNDLSKTTKQIIVLKLNSSLIHSKVLAISHHHSKGNADGRVLYKKLSKDHRDGDEWDNAEADTRQQQPAISGLRRNHIPVFCRTK